MRLDPELLGRIDKLELLARQVVEGYLAGRHKSPRHGFAVEFSEHREYAPGDDIRHIDWRVFARTDRYTIKQYEQETNLVSWFLVDASESMRVGVPGVGVDPSRPTKADAASALVGALAHLITRQGDSVGLVRLGDGPEARLRPSGQPRQPREVLRVLAGPAKVGPSDPARALREVGPTLGRRGVVFVVGDFLDDVDELAAALGVYRSHKHDVALIQVLDGAEIDFPFTQPTVFKGLEALGELRTDPRAIRDAYLAGFNAHQAKLRETCRVLGIDHTLVRTDENLGAAMVRLLRSRDER